MTGYLDSSIILRWLLDSENQFQGVKKFSGFISSELLIIESNRVLDRYRLENWLSDKELSQSKKNLNRIIEGLSIIEMGKSIKERASQSFPTIIGTLDSIHLATAILYKEEINISDLWFITHDKQQANCAGALGLDADGI